MTSNRPTLNWSVNSPTIVLSLSNLPSSLVSRLNYPSTWLRYTISTRPALWLALSMSTARHSVVRGRLVPKAGPIYGSMVWKCYSLVGAPSAHSNVVLTSCPQEAGHALVGAPAMTAVPFLSPNYARFVNWLSALISDNNCHSSSSSRLRSITFTSILTLR